MSHGIPLTDADRAPWLAAIHARLLDSFRHGESLVVGCSALKRSCRRGPPDADMTASTDQQNGDA